MKNWIRWTQTYLMYALPFVLICMAWGSLRTESEIVAGAGLATRAAWEILSWNLMLWFAVLIAFLVALVSSPDAREKTLLRLARIKERDEREQQITGLASRRAYVSTLSLLILLLFLSMFSFNVTRVPADQAVNGKRGTLSIDMRFNLWDEPVTTASPTGDVLVEARQLPLSKPAILLMLLIWQIGAFSLSARRELRATEA